MHTNLQLYEQHGKGVDRTDGEDGVGPGKEVDLHKGALYLN